MKETYLTISNSGCDEFVIQKSRFIGYASPCQTEEEAQQFILDIREKHRDAKHHCYAYVIGLNSGIMRYSDDGEPAGTAGMPIMDVLKKEGIVNCCVVVVRYFGGVLLGTGGLVRSYTQGCKIALRAAAIIRMEMTSVRRCRVVYSVWNQMQHILQNSSVVLDNIVYSDAVEFDIIVRNKDCDEVFRMIDNLTGGKVAWLKTEEKYMPWTV